MGIEYVGKRTPKSGVKCRCCGNGGLEWVPLPYGKWGLVSKKSKQDHRCAAASGKVRQVTT
jgi:hypothetical protein